MQTSPGGSNRSRESFACETQEQISHAKLRSRRPGGTGKFRMRNSEADGAAAVKVSHAKLLSRGGRGGEAHLFRAPGREPAHEKTSLGAGVGRVLDSFTSLAGFEAHAGGGGWPGPSAGRSGRRLARKPSSGGGDGRGCPAEKTRGRCVKHMIMGVLSMRSILAFADCVRFRCSVAEGERMKELPASWRPFMRKPPYPTELKPYGRALVDLARRRDEILCLSGDLTRQCEVRPVPGRTPGAVHPRRYGRGEHDGHGRHARPLRLHPVRAHVRCLVPPAASRPDRQRRRLPEEPASAHHRVHARRVVAGRAEAAWFLNRGAFEPTAPRLAAIRGTEKVRRLPWILR